MKKLKKAVISVLTAAAICGSVFGMAACGGNYADYINPSDGSPDTSTPDDGAQGYDVLIKSEGGLPLNGVMVNAKKDGQTVATGYSINGKIHLDIPEGQYKLEIVGNLPDGYYLPDDADYTTPSDGNQTTIYLPSKIIETTVGSNVTYKVGDIMHTFSFVDTDGERHALSDIAQGKKLVVLNFWATWCSPCKSEFPGLTEAYELYKDEVEVIALSIDDGIDAIKTFRSQNNISFYMGEDSTQLRRNNFGPDSSIPLSVFIDRYGAIANIHSGSLPSAAVWAGMFSTYTSDNYVQNPDTSSGGDETELVKPNVSAPDPSVVENAAMSASSAEGKITNFGEDMSDSDKEYNWPWVTDIDGDRVYVKATNNGYKYSYAIFTANIKMQSGDILSYDYKLNCSTSGTELMAVIIDDYPIKSYSTGTDGWQTESRAYVATHDIEGKLIISYQRTTTGDIIDELAAIDNLKVVHASQAGTSVDIPVAAVSGDLQENGQYENYLSVTYNEADGFYHDSATGNLLVADILNGTPWTEHVSGAKFTSTENTELTSSLYNISWWLMSNYKTVDEDSGIYLSFDYGHTDTIVENYYLQLFSDTEYVPVTQALKEAIEAFAEAYCTKYEKSYYDNQWLEFCYIFKHYGSDHIAGDVCYENTDPTAGRGMHNAFTAVEDQVNKVNITHASTYNGGGMYYKFVPSASGVYKFYSSDNTYVDDLGSTVTTDPEMFVKDEEGNYIYTFDSDETYNCERDEANFVGYGYLEAGTTYYLQCRTGETGGTGKYSFYATCVGDSYAQLRKCSTGAGVWSSSDEYMAIPTAVGPDGYYHHVENGKFKSVVYLDFTHFNYFVCKLDNNGTLITAPVYDMVINGMFDLSTSVGIDYTAEMLEYYNKSIEGKTVDDELYGMIEVDETLCDILVAFTMINSAEHDGRASNYWLSMCCYYQYYGTQAS